MLKIVGELAAAWAYGVILVAMGLVTLTLGTLLATARLAWWAFCLPMTIGRKA